jgi:hypothetical protein
MTTMSAESSFQVIASDYAQAVRGYFAPVALSRAASAERGAAAREISAQREVAAEAVLKQSEAFNTAAEDALAKRYSAEVQLQALAKLATDLEVARDLLQTGDEEASGTLTAQGAGERAANSIYWIEKDLAVVEGKGVAERGTKIIRDVDTGKAELLSSVGSVMFLIPDRSLTLSNKIVKEIFDFGLDTLAKGSGKLIEMAAGFLGQTENLNKLVDLGRRFLKSAYDFAMQLLGKAGLDIIKEKITTWVDDKLQNREQMMATWLKDLYKAEATEKQLQQKIEGSSAGLEKYGSAISSVDALNETYRKCTDALDKGLGAIVYLRGFAFLKAPEGVATLTGLLLLLMGVVVLTGAALLDSPRVAALKRVQGVSDIVTRDLG